MNIVIDTNIVFSTLLNPNSVVGELLMNVTDGIDFYAPDLLKAELSRYSTKILNYSKLSSATLSDVESSIFSIIKFVPEKDISENSWLKAYTLTKEIDEDDTPFIALAIELNAVYGQATKY